MIPFNEAFELIMQDIPLMGVERINFSISLGRVLRQDVISDLDMPPFDKSAMDGYACRMQDIDKTLKVIEVIPAGKIPERFVSERECSKIMTGAIVPGGADCVMKVEDTEVPEEGYVRYTGHATRSNIARKGEDVKTGAVVLRDGLQIQPQHIAVMASVGCVEPFVSKMVRVGVLSTGDEIVEPERKPGPSQIRNSNGYQLFAQIMRSSAEPVYYGIAEDSAAATREIIEKAMDECDVVLLTGGVSMGDFDFIPGVLDDLGTEILFKTVAIQPGKPTVFCKMNDKRIFGLPGNPVSSFNTFEIFVRPLIMKMMGWNGSFPTYRLPMGKKYRRKKSHRMSWMPVMIGGDGKVYPMEYHGSAHIHALSDAHGMIALPVGATELKEGEMVNVRPI
ncbi:MAG: molybdopterin molybdotransferase MoeA [Bacteroidales bacterium]